MTERKFTPPTEFPAEYVDGEGRKAVILGRVSVGGYPLIGYILYTELGSVWPAAMSWSEEGKNDFDWPSADDLHDIPKRITTWHNIYKTWLGHQCSTRSDADDIHNSIGDYVTEERLCVYRIERDEDGSNPEMFKEEV